MESALRRPPEPGKWISAALSLLMHAVLVLVLFYGVQWQRRTPEPVAVELVRGLPAVATAPAAPVVAPAKALAPQPEPKPVVKPVVKPVAKTEPAPVKPVVKPDIALKPDKPKKEPVKKVEKVIEPPKVETKSKEPAKTEPKRPEPKAPAKLEDPVADRMKAMLESTSRQVASVSARNKLDAAAKEASERRASAERAAALGKATEEWGRLIEAQVRRRIVRPRDYPGNPTLEFEIELLPDRSLIGEPRLVKGSGHPELDEAVKRAIVAASPLPAPPKAEAFQRKLRLIFHPME